MSRPRCFCKLPHDWQASVEDSCCMDDWHVVDHNLAPATATAEQVADAIRATLANN